METFAGFGYTAGPMVGAVLYELGGFQLPFFVLGVVLIIAALLSCILIEGYEGLFLWMFGLFYFLIFRQI